jgi:hypothetical protein
VKERVHRVALMHKVVQRLKVDEHIRGAKAEKADVARSDRVQRCAGTKVKRGDGQGEV